MYPSPRLRRFALVPMMWVALLGIVVGVGFYLTQTTPAPIVPPAFTDEPTATPTESAKARATSLPPTKPNATLTLPTLGIFAEIITAYIDEDGAWDVSQLGMRVGHLDGTAWVNQVGNVVLSGHVEMADGRLGVFAPLEQLKVGDVLTIEDRETLYRYQVYDIRYVTPNIIDVLEDHPTRPHTLTLITCSGYRFVSNEYAERLVVFAEFIPS